MILDYKTLKSLPVETESGMGLGFVVDFELDTSGHNISKYLVAKPKFFPGALRLVIAPAQIVRVTNEKIVVQDTIEPLSADSAVSRRTVAEDSGTVNAEMDK